MSLFFLWSTVSVGSVVLVRQRRHFLSLLLVLEVVLLLVASFILLGARCAGLGVSGALFVLLTLGACEAAIGLAVLVLLVRSYGHDRLRSLASQL